MVIARTQRVLLRQLVGADADAMMRVFGDPDVMRFGPGVQTEDWVLRWLARCIDEYSLRGYGLWAVEELLGREVIGYCGLTLFPDINGRSEVEVGYRLARRFWGRGYATEAARAVRDHALGALGMHRLIALVDPANAASIRVAEKLGMQHEADAMLEGYTHPDRVYAISRSAMP